MERTRLAPLVGIVGTLAVVVLLAIPYVLVRSSPGTAVATYYGSGAINPLFAGVFAVVTAIVLAAGYADRTDPTMAAGVAITLGVFLVGLLGAWAATVPLEVVLGVDAPTIIRQHRSATVAAAAVVPLAGAWWARTLGVV